MTFLLRPRLFPLSTLLVTAQCVFLVSCSGGGASTPESDDVISADSANVISGLVAIGAGQEALVSVTGASGVVAQEFSTVNGQFEVDVSNLVTPYRVEAALVGTESVLYGWAESPIHTNVNQLTTRVIDEALAGSPITAFYDGQLDRSALSVEALARSEQSVKDGLLVQILSNGVDPEMLNVFHTPFEPNTLGYDTLLDALNLNGLALDQADYSAFDAERMRRVLNRFTTVGADGSIRPDTEKLTLEYFAEFTETLYQRMRASNVLRPYIIDGTEIRDVTTASASAAVREAVLDIAIRTAIDSFGTLLEFDDADIEFLQELSSVPLGFNLFNAIRIMHNGLSGEDTSREYEALEVLLERSALGPERREATARSLIRFFSRDMNSVVCEIPLLSIGREDSCTISEPSVVPTPYTIALDGDGEVRASEVPPRFGVTDLAPLPGSVITSSQVIVPVVSITWDSPVYGGGDTLRVEPLLSITNESNSTQFVCPSIEFNGSNTLSCLFAPGSFEFDTSYSISASVESADGELVSDVFYRFSTPAWPYADFEITPVAGTYESPINVFFSGSADRSIHFRRDVGMPSVTDEERTAASTALSIDTTTTLSAAVFEDGVRVSPVVRRLYKIVPQPEEPSADTPPATALSTDESQEPDTSNVEVGNLTITLNYPIPETDNNANLRNSIAWYFSNPDEKLFVAECSTRKGITNDTVAGDPLDWLNVFINLANAGIAQDANIMLSIRACVDIATLQFSGNTFEEAVTTMHCETEVERPNNYNNIFRDNYEFNELCEVFPEGDATDDNVNNPAPDDSDEEFVLNVPQEDTEFNSNLRNSIAWYIANPDASLHSIECATRPAGGFVQGSGANVFVNPGFVVDTGTGITIGDNVLGWGAVSNILESRGVALFLPIQKSVRACELVLATVNTSSTYDEAVTFTVGLNPGVFVDFP